MKNNNQKNLVEENKSLKAEINKLYKKLEYSEKNRTEFLANIKNKVNNPLNSIIVLSEYLKEKSSENNEDQETISLVHRETVNLSFALGNLILAGEIEAGAASIEPSMFYVKELIEDCVKMFKSNIEDKEIILDIKCPSSLKIHTDRAKLGVVIQNLLSNAIEFNINNGNVTIVALKKDNDGNIEISVADTGIGFSEKDSEFMFMRFTQLQEGPDRNYVSAGIGLCLVNNIIELLDGQLNYKGQLGKGSVFTILINTDTGKIGNNTFILDENDVLFDSLVEDTAEF